jgi:acyl carrier protein phosphodiesterase
MNYLAHAYLSFNHPPVLVGNMISDFVKGKKKYAFEPEVQAGIMLHRYIDGFTDSHRATLEAKKIFRPAVGLYAGAFMDIVYDHFLALDPAELPEPEWIRFAGETYQTLLEFREVLPEKFSRILPFMKEQNWLYNYRFETGIENSFRGLAMRAAYLQSSTAAFREFQKEYEYLRSCYSGFFKDVKIFASTRLTELLHAPAVTFVPKNGL